MPITSGCVWPPECDLCPPRFLSFTGGQGDSWLWALWLLWTFQHMWGRQTLTLWHRLPIQTWYIALIRLYKHLVTFLLLKLRSDLDLVDWLNLGTDSYKLCLDRTPLRISLIRARALTVRRPYWNWNYYYYFLWRAFSGPRHGQKLMNLWKFKAQKQFCILE